MMPQIQGTISDTNPTAFELMGWGMVFAASRGITCKYDLLENGSIVYDVWGVAGSTGRQALNLFTVDVSNEDNWPPGFAGLWKGTALIMHGTDAFCQPAQTPQVRPSADGNLFWFDGQMNQLPSQAGAVWLRYRPLMNVVVDGWSQRDNEWDGTTGWTLKLKETR